LHSATTPEEEWIDWGGEKKGGFPSYPSWGRGNKGVNRGGKTKIYPTRWGAGECEVNTYKKFPDQEEKSRQHQRLTLEKRVIAREKGGKKKESKRLGFD